jgi:hypothetical protein
MELPSPPVSQPPLKPLRQSRRGKGNAEDVAATREHSHVPEALPKTGRTRNRKARGGSVSSSAVASSVRGRTRSQSVLSQEVEPSSQRTVKPEPPSTPADTGPLSDIAGSEPTPTEARITRRRAGTLQSSIEEAPAPKRKRGAREISEDSSAPGMRASSPNKQVVVASRNFHRTSATIMNDITGHKYASYFAQPVKERHVEGYKDIIRRPQDLKSIRKAIVDGQRAVATFTASNSTSFDASQQTALASPGGTNAGGGTVVLPAHPDIMPPKGIVNSSQFEKEIMRMFANAVMFNPGDEGMVRDTREMAEDVQSMVKAWRGAERTQTGTPVHMLGAGKGRGEDDTQTEDEEGLTKRRKA